MGQQETKGRQTRQVVRSVLCQPLRPPVNSNLETTNHRFDINQRMAAGFASTHGSTAALAGWLQSWLGRRSMWSQGLLWCSWWP